MSPAKELDMDGSARKVVAAGETRPKFLKPGVSSLGRVCG